MQKNSLLKEIISNINLSTDVSPENTPSESDIIASRHMLEVYKGQVRSRSEDLGVPLYIG